MKFSRDVSRRGFLASAAAAPVAAKFLNEHVPIGLELYSVRDELKKDQAGTLEQVAKMGYECVEFFAPYYDWTPDQAKAVREQLDSLKLRCYSTHNSLTSFTTGINKAIELNKILGAKFIVLAHPGDKLATIDDWKNLAATINKAHKAFMASGLRGGYHNHDLEWKPVDGQKPIEIIAQNTMKNFMLQLDVGTCVETGNDPVAWVNSNPGRINSLHLKDWSPDEGYKVLFGEGVVPWKKLLAAAEDKGGVEYYLIEQEGSRFPEMETAERCLVAFKNLHG